jgi:hypothetical protein
MSSSRPLGVFAALAMLVSVGCGGRERDESPRSTSRAAPVATQGDSTIAGSASALSSGQAGTKPVCLATGAWQMCSVIERLERAGLAPRREEGTVREPPLTSAGIAIMLGRSELRVFLYTDRAARERDQARLDRRKYLAASEPVSMQAEPTLITSENLLAILRSRSDHQRERVSDALTAGPPQKPAPRG